MGHERWFRGQHDGQGRPFDWLTPARLHGIPWQRAQALYEQAVQQARGAGSGRVQEHYLALLADARLDTWRPAPGKVTRTMRLEAHRAGKKRRDTSASLEAPRAADRPAAQDLSVPDALSDRRLQAYLAAAVGHFEELGALNHERPAAEPTAEALQPSNAVGRPKPSTDHGWAAGGMSFLTDRSVDRWDVLGPIQAPALNFLHPDRHRVEPRAPAVLRATTEDATGGGPEGHGDAAMLQALRYSPGQALPSDVLRLMEHLLHHSFADVLIHVDNSASEQAASLDARAFTIGNRIFFRQDAYRPDTDRGRELLAHELTHVIQWHQGRVPAVAGQPPRISSPGDYLEQEATTLGRQAAAQVRRGDEGAFEAPAFQTGPSSTGSAGRITASAVRIATGAMILRDGPTDPHASVSTIPTGGTPIGRVGIVAWDRRPELRLRSSASTSADNVIASLAFNTTLQVIKELPGGWYFVSTQDGQLGYVAKAYVETNLPEPNAKLHRVESGLPGFAISIAERYYRQHAQDWGQDLRFYVNILAWVNNRAVPDTTSGWRDVHFDAGEFIWIPSHGFALTLRGVVNSGSISHNIADSIGIADFLDRAEQLYRDIDTAIRLSAQYLPEAIARHVEAALLGVLESLALMMALAAGVLAVSTAIGAGLGALAGGGGAAPGAALGFEVGMVLLQWLGLGMLVVWIGQSLLRVGSAFGDFLVMVWNARGDQAQLDLAARQFAEAIGTLCGVLLEGLVMWAVSIGATRAINGLRGTRFGSRFNNSETGQWLNERVRRVQAGDAPLPPTRAVLERLTRSVKLVDARNAELGEFDWVDIAGRRFIENKSATGIDRPNPRTGRPQQTALQWAERQITTKTTNRIHALANAAATRGPAGQAIPSLAEIQGFRHIHFVIDGTSPALRAAVFAELANLRAAHPGWTFTAGFGTTFTIPPVPGSGTPEE
jgi:hypothetical protein